jgi:hypothetical protein
MRPQRNCLGPVDQNVARQLLCGTYVNARPNTEGSFWPQLLRCMGASYVAFAAVLAIAALLAGDSGQGAILAVMMLTPVAVTFTTVAARFGAAATSVARSGHVRASVRRTLAALGKGYRIVPSLSVSPEREDQVAIGPNGIFVIVARDDRGRVTASARQLFVDARPAWRDLIEDCRVDALRVRERVRREIGHEVPVHSVLCFARALVAVGQEIRGVKIVHASRLARLIASTPIAAALPATEIDTAAAALARGTLTSLAIPLRSTVREARPQLQAERRLALVNRAPARRHDAS